jgi:hypothetical protein
MRGLPPRRRRASLPELLITAGVTALAVYALGWVLDGTAYSVVGVVALLLWGIALVVLTSREARPETRHQNRSRPSDLARREVVGSGGRRGLDRKVSVRRYLRRSRNPSWRELLITGAVALAVVVPLRWVLDPTWYYIACFVGLAAWAVSVRVVTNR